MYYLNILQKRISQKKNTHLNFIQSKFVENSMEIN